LFLIAPRCDVVNETAHGGRVWMPIERTKALPFTAGFLIFLLSASVYTTPPR
jgi:hypothetical protein